METIPKSSDKDLANKWLLIDDRVCHANFIAFFAMNNIIGHECFIQIVAAGGNL